MKYMLFLLMFSSVSLAKSITLTTHNLSPYGSYQDKKMSRFDGVAIRVVRCALKKIDYKLNLKVVPWARAQHEVRYGAADGFFAASENSERDGYGVKSAQIADQKWQWFYLEEKNPAFKNGKIIHSSFYGSNMQRWIQKNNFRTGLPPKDTEALVDLVIKGMVDVGLANNYVLDEILKRKKMSHKFHVETLKNKPLYVYLSKKFISKNNGFLISFNRAVNSCK